MAIAEVEERESEITATAVDAEPIAGAEYREGNLQPGCLICGQTIPEKAARSRAKVCSDLCRATYRRWRRMDSAARRAQPPLCCQVCRGAIPFRPNVVWAETCSPACRNAVRRYRFQILQSQKCPHCYHPSTPAEWEEFRAWRASRGPMQGFFRDAHGRGNLAWQREKALREALGTAVGIVEHFRDSILKQNGVEKMEDLVNPESMATDFMDAAQIRDYESEYELAASVSGKIREFQTLLVPNKRAIRSENGE